MKRILFMAIVTLGAAAATATDARADSACGGSVNFGIDLGFKWGFSCWNKCCCPSGPPAMYNAYPAPAYGYPAPGYGYAASPVGYPAPPVAGNGYNQAPAQAGYTGGYGGVMPVGYGYYGGYGY